MVKYNGCNYICGYKEHPNRFDRIASRLSPDNDPMVRIPLVQSMPLGIRLDLNVTRKETSVVRRLHPFNNAVKNHVVY